jgi:hypothetical protein
MEFKLTNTGESEMLVRDANGKAITVGPRQVRPVHLKENDARFLARCAAQGSVLKISAQTSQARDVLAGCYRKPPDKAPEQESRVDVDLVAAKAVQAATAGGTVQPPDNGAAADQGTAGTAAGAGTAAEAPKSAGEVATGGAGTAAPLAWPAGPAGTAAPPAAATAAPAAASPAAPLRRPVAKPQPTPKPKAGRGRR